MKTLPQNTQAAIDAVLRETHFKGFTNAEITLAIATAKELNLSISRNEIYFFKRGGAVLNIVSVHALTKLASDSGLFNGMEVDQPKPKMKYVYLNGQVKEMQDLACTAKVWRKDCPRPFEATVFASEYANNGGSWAKMPTTMLQKVAKCHALRMAFSFGAVYDSAEIANLDDVEVAAPAPAAAPAIPAVSAQETQTVEVTPSMSVSTIEAPQALREKLQQLGLSFQIKEAKDGTGHYIAIEAGLRTKRCEATLRELGFHFNAARRLWWRAL